MHYFHNVKIDHEARLRLSEMNEEEQKKQVEQVVRQYTSKALLPIAWNIKTHLNIHKIFLLFHMGLIINLLQPLFPFVFIFIVVIMQHWRPD